MIVRGAVGVFVGPLGDGETVGDGSNLLTFDFASVAAEKKRAVIAGSLRNVKATFGERHVGTVVEEEVSHVGTSTDAGPSVVRAVEVLATAGIATADDGPSAAVGLGLRSVLTDGEHDFLHGFGVAVVVAHEELLIAAEAGAAGGTAEVVAAVDGAGGEIHGVFPARCADVGFRIEVEAGEHQIDSHLVDLPEVCAFGVSGSEEVAFKECLVFFLNPSEEFGCKYFLRFFRVKGGLERSSSEEVEVVLIVHGAEEAHLGAALLALVVGEVSVEVEEVVALRDVVADAVVEHAGEEVLGVPGEVEELRLTGVILPSPETFVSGEFLLFPDTAEEGVLAGVVGDVRRVGGAFLS